MGENKFEQVKSRVIKALAGLSPQLTYHSIDHTLDVVRESERIAREEGITDERRLFLLKIAALYHDTGFLRIYAGHEAASCDIFMEDARLLASPDSSSSSAEAHSPTGNLSATTNPSTDRPSSADALCFTDSEKETIRGLIMATRVPQQPNNLLEKIICDADLDYLGRPDFLTIGDHLRIEFLHYGVVKSDAEWERLQLKFLEAHRYHTASSQRLREPGKQANYKQLL